MLILVVGLQHTLSVLRKVFGLKKEEIRGDREKNGKMKNFMFSTSCQMFFWWPIKEDDMARECGIYGGTEMLTNIWCENMKERCHL